LVKSKLSRRELLAVPAALFALRATEARAAPMSLAIHQNTSLGAGYRGSLEGWARAGIKRVEINHTLLDAFVKSDSLAAAGRVLTDLGLTPVSASCGVPGLIERSWKRRDALDALERRCEMLATLGLARTYTTTATTIAPNADDYRAAAENVQALGEIGRQYQMTIMLEFVRQSTFVSTLPSLVSIVRAAGHRNTGILFDCYHYWSGLNKLEDLDRLRPGEIAHVHLQDVPDMPREMLDLTTRAIPGDGVTPLVEILQKLASRAGYSGALSVELFAPAFQGRDPYELAREIQTKAEAVMRKANVL
jgi:sugar phosphate isomerase/epimerase